MKHACKIFTVALVLVLAASTSLLAAMASAEVSVPSVPQFSLPVVDNSRYVPETFTTDSYTGQTTSQGGYTLENITVQVTIKNQPFTSSLLPDGNVTQLRYAVRFKGHFDGWSGSSEQVAYAVQVSGKGETVVEYFKGWSGYSSSGYQQLPNIDGAQVDFQVKAQVGYDYSYNSGDGYPFPLHDFNVLAESSWSDIQTVILPGADDPAPQPTSTPLQVTSPQYPQPTENAALPPQQSNPEGFAEINLDSDVLLQAAVLAVVLVVVAALIVVMVRPR
ncbi:MAG: hypothetical protein NWE93_01970 [Candidatus Bathyarchaeota archaeon]|nr:hypothetical protein [Candidatus Bathyarchaeota archaeon]